jgi:hypothetical protein
MSVRSDVDRGLEIRDAIEKLEVELKDIEVRLKHAGLNGEQVDLTDADREGKQFLARGSDRVIPVVFTSDMIIGEFTRSSKKHTEINSVLVAESFKLLQFFKPVQKFENLFGSGKKFRLHAAELLGDKAPAFITACVARDKEGIPKSAIKVMWDDSKVK